MPDKLHLHPLRDVCVQYENNLANGFRDIVRKRTTDARPNGDNKAERVNKPLMLVSNLETPLCLLVDKKGLSWTTFE